MSLLSKNIHKVKPLKISKLIKKLDIEMSKLVREKGVCEMANSEFGMCGGLLQDAHIIGRRNYTLRWNIFNHICLCYRHHIFIWHHDPVEALIWFQNKFPERWSYLLETKNKILKRDTDELLEILENIKNRNLKALITT